MSSQYQNALSNARVNITLDLIKNHHNIKKELPLKLLVLGDFSGGQNPRPLSQRSSILIDKTYFNDVMRQIAPNIDIEVPDCINNNVETLSVNLTFESLKDFTPYEIAKKIPSLRQMLAMRLLLKELKRHILDNKQFRKALDTLLKDKKRSDAVFVAIQSLKKETENNWERVDD